MAEKKAIYKVKTDAGYDEIHFKTVAEQVNYTMKKDNSKVTTQKIIDDIVNLNLDTMLELRYGMKGDGVADETALLQKALNENDVVYIPKKFTIGVSESIRIEKSKQLISDGRISKSAGVIVSNAKDVLISGINFNMNKAGMTSIRLNAATRYLIRECTFTGFKMGTNTNNDGGIRIDSSTDGVIAFNQWYDHGYDHTIDVGQLNRCISIAGKCDNTLVIGNTFKKVNQAIVTDSKNIRISNNHFENVKDNGVYCVGESENIIIEGNTFKNSEDECIVVSGVGGFTIDNNIFHEANNKVFSINGNLSNLSITDNTVKCSKPPANVLAWRTTTSGAIEDFTVTNFVLSGNTFEVNEAAKYPLFFFGNIDGGICEDNYFKFNRKDVLIRFSGTTKLEWVFKNNTLKNMDDTASGVTIMDFSGAVANKNFILDSCKLINGRISKSAGVIVKNMRFQPVNANAYILGMAENNVLWNSTTSAPTDGTWNVGDIIYSTQPSAGGHIGWVYTTAKAWKPFGKIE